MVRNHRLREQWLGAFACGFAAILLLAPPAARADSGHGDYDRHRERDRYAAHRAHDHHRAIDDWHHASHKKHHRAAHKRHHRASHKRHHPVFGWWRDAHGKWRAHDHHQVGHYCRPCDRYFRARDAFYDHVRHRHEVPYRQFSFALSVGAFGLIFSG